MSIDTFLAFGASLELHALYLRVETECPYSYLATSKLHAIYTALLSSANTDHLTILSIAHGVRLSVLQGDVGHNQITGGVIVNHWRLGLNILRDIVFGDQHIVTLLCESHSVYFAVFH